MDGVLRTLDDLQSTHEISIIRISEPISNSTPLHDDEAAAAAAAARQRTSDASNASLDAPTPVSLDADLAHYRELFAKLRFSYVEQVTKEKFIRAIVGDPPLIVTMQENLDLEKENGAAKSELKALKLEVADMVAELESRGRALSRRYEGIQLETARLRELPQEIAGLEARIGQLREQQQQQAVGGDPTQNLPLGKTTELVAARKREQQQLARELEALQARAPRKRKEAERLQAEVAALETRRQNGMAAAREAQRRKEASLGGAADDLEQRARWWRANEGLLKQVLDIET